MMTDREAMNALVASVGLLLCWVLGMFLYRDYRMELFRQRLFKARDELFDYATDGGIAFDHPAYTLVRSTMNGFIRFADRMSFASVAATGWMIGAERSEAASFSARLAEAMQDLSEEQRETVQKAVNQMHFNVIDHVIMTSPLLIAMIIPVACLLIARAAGQRAGHLVMRPFTSSRWSLAADTLALTYGTEPSFA